MNLRICRNQNEKEDKNTLCLNCYTEFPRYQAQGFFYFWLWSKRRMTQESFTTTALALVKQGIGRQSHQQACALCKTSALLATIISKLHGLHDMNRYAHF